jgi:hypothetical protein
LCDQRDRPIACTIDSAVCAGIDPGGLDIDHIPSDRRTPSGLGDGAVGTRVGARAVGSARAVNIRANSGVTAGVRRPVDRGVGWASPSQHKEHKHTESYNASFHGESHSFLQVR